jgi:PAS domain S-box-containing protein
LKLGNVAGDVWTDLSTAVPAPPFGSPGATKTYATGTGERRMGTTVTVPGTPWLLWVEMSERAILQPAATLLRRMVPVAILLTVLGTFAVYAASSRITKPLEATTVAAEAIAAGDYTRRVNTTRRDEIGRLAAAFNSMAERVAESHRILETHVQERTRALEDAREELDRFFSLSLDLLCIAGTDGRFRRVNPAWEQVLGWTVGDLTAIPYLDLVHPDDRAATIREASKLAEGGTTLNFENRYRTKDGSYRWLSWKSASVPGRGLVYAAANDVTDQKATERALHQYGSELATANRELESFSYSVSHDLRSPLRSIDGFAQALVEDYEDRLDDTGRAYLARIRAAAQRMGMLIDDLLSLSRVSRGELSRTTVDLTALAAEIAARLREQDPTRQVEWRIQAGLQAHGDPRLLRIALDNLLGNAWKFTSKRETAIIEMSVETQPGQPTVFRVRDNGAGFDMAHASKLFGAFQRLHGVQEFAGTGIGLATVQRIMHRHGGRVWAEGTVERGATFFFTLEAA